MATSLSTKSNYSFFARSSKSVNCRPHASRQRIDLGQLTKLQDTSPEQILRDLLSENRACKVTALTRPPKKQEEEATDSPEAEETEEQKADKKVRKAFAEQTSVLNKVRGIVEDDSSRFKIAQVITM
jgi:hypothetical protein